MYVKRVILYIIMVMLAGVVAAQDEKVDALLQRYDAANESSRRIIAKEFFEELRALEFVDKMPKIDFNSHSLDTLNMLVNYYTSVKNMTKPSGAPNLPYRCATPTRCAPIVRAC